MWEGRSILLKREVACSMPMEARWVHGNAIVAETLHRALAQVTDQSGTPLADDRHRRSSARLWAHVSGEYSLLQLFSCHDSYPGHSQ